MLKTKQRHGQGLHGQAHGQDLLQMIPSPHSDVCQKEIGNYILDVATFCRCTSPLDFLKILLKLFKGPKTNKSVRATPLWFAGARHYFIANSNGPTRHPIYGSNWTTPLRATEVHHHFVVVAPLWVIKLHCARSTPLWVTKMHHYFAVNSTGLAICFIPYSGHLFLTYFQMLSK